MIKAVIFDYGGVINRHLRLQPQILNLAKELRQQQVITAVLSNMIAPIAWYVKRRGGIQDFAPVVISSDVGYSKPNPKIYRLIIDKLGVRPEECIFIDNRKRNIIPAQSLGLKVVLARKPEQVVADVKNMLHPQRPLLTPSTVHF